jgi:hypothetical protein
MGLLQLVVHRHNGTDKRKIASLLRHFLRVEKCTETVVDEVGFELINCDYRKCTVGAQFFSNCTLKFKLATRVLVRIVLATRVLLAATRSRVLECT